MAEKKINLCLGVHNHQPVGNFYHVLEKACERCYLPFLQVLERHPAIKISVHYSGYLLSWIRSKYPEVLHALQRLVERGQIELLTGGYYEPILPIIPDADKIGQIDKLTDYLYELFSTENRTPDIAGLWLAERAWEPHLPRILSLMGIRYVCVDDSHFKQVGISDDRLLGSFLTEEQGATVELFPVSEKLRYEIPFQNVPELIDYMKNIASSDGRRGAFYFDDGEKFGVWPGTHTTCYSKGWLDRFFSALEENADWIQVKTFGEYSREFGPSNPAYLPSSSYTEMMNWSMPADASSTSGGFWRSFLVKYPESGNLHKKMLRVSNKLYDALDDDCIPDSALESIQDSLWIGQSNDPLWHGDFGGLYLTNLRTTNYQSLIEAETAIDSLVQAKNGNQGKILIQKTDFDFDGSQEVLVETPHCNYYIDPAYGGALFELDYKERPFNLMDTLARRRERYHENLQKEMEGELIYDWYRRLSFLDHFFEQNVTLEDLETAKFAEQGDFVNQPYELEEILTDGKKGEVNLIRHGHVWCQRKQLPVDVSKSYIFDCNSEVLKVFYQVRNLSDSQAEFWFAPELNFNFLAADSSDRYYFDPSGIEIKDTRLSSRGSIADASGLGIADEWLNIRMILTWSSRALVWRFPVYSQSFAHGKPEKLYQGSAIVPSWRLSLEPDQFFTVNFDLGIHQN